MTVEPEKHGPPNWWALAQKRSKGSKTSTMMQIINAIKGKLPK
jgi:hypothetical protein